ncbi:MAG: L-seryl-tRNA(Sec) kinase [Promethearchaeota archaeon CR_4]|nr:MAG: L-seryl-tRNA(Sec) kinase [Candidatus Lokiarchaeota archaeon CR_4]
MTGLLLLLAGLPSSGKSTLAGAIQAHLPSCLPQRYPNIKIVDPDCFRGNEHKLLPFRPEDEPKIKKRLIEITIEYLKAGYAVIVDDLNYYQSMRHDLLRLALELDVPYSTIFVNTPIEVCLTWNEKRGRKIPNELIEKIAQKFDYFGRYAWDQPDFAVNFVSSNFTLDAFLKQLCEFLEKHTQRRPYFQSRDASLTIQPPSIKNFLDVRSRKIISDFIMDRDLKIQQKEIKQLRKELLRKSPANLEEVQQILDEFQGSLELLTNKKSDPAKSNQKKFNSTNPSRH